MGDGGGVWNRLVMFYFTRQFAHHAARKAYETRDGKRIGFVMHNVIGGIGKKVEVSVGNARVIRKDGSAFGASLLPVRVKGLGKNVLIDSKGKFYWSRRLFDLLKEGDIVAGVGGAGGILGGQTKKLSHRG